MKWEFPYCPSPGGEVNWDALDAAFDWVRNLREVPQDPRWHAEGDVWIHTRMVLEALVGMEEYARLPRQEQVILFTATLLHDVAKPVTTRTEPDGRITSPKHSLVGERMARKILWEGKSDVGLIPPPFEIREQICELIRYHGLPLNFKFDDFTEKRMRKVSQMAGLSHLSFLAQADVMGRYCEDKENLLERPLLFAEFARELDCLQHPFPFQDKLSRYDYFRKEDGNAFYTAFDDRKFECVIMSGLPGAGKDTWIRNNLPEWPVVSLDAIRKEMGISPKDNQGSVVQTARERAREYMRASENFVWNATNISRDLRRNIISLVAEYNGKPRIVYIEPAFEKLMPQNQSREEGAVVPRKVMEHLVTRLDVPEPWEAVEVDYITP